MKMMSCFLLVAAFAHYAPSNAQAQEKAAPAAVRQEFDGFIKKFRTALKANDAKAVAGLARLPFQNDSAIGDAAQFGAKIYKPDFTPKTRACLQREKPAYDRDGEGNDTYAIACGEVIFVFTRTPAGFLLTDIGMND